jgi:hypothetical protein
MMRPAHDTGSTGGQSGTGMVGDAGPSRTKWALPGGWTGRVPAMLLLLCILLILPMHMPVSAAQSTLWGPYLTATTTCSTIISWRSPEASDGTILCANDSWYRLTGTYDRTIRTPAPACQQHLNITGLKPGTLYHYRLVLPGIPGEDHHFRTFPEQGRVFFAVYGDTRDQLPSYSQAERHRIVAEAIAAEDPLFVIHTGDFVTDGDNPEDWDRFFSAGKNMLSNTTIFPTPGNHEQDSGLYHEIFGIPGWYSFSIAGIHFAVLDSSDPSGLSGQVSWLDSDLAGTEPFRFVVLHHPPFSSEGQHDGGWKDVREALKPVLDRHNVTAVFAGHVHAYERDIDNRTTYVTIATGGAPPYALSATKIPQYQNSLENVLGFIWITVDPLNDIATLTMVRVADISPETGTVNRIDPGGSVFESVSLVSPDTSPAFHGGSSRIIPLYLMGRMLRIPYSE